MNFFKRYKYTFKYILLFKYTLILILFILLNQNELLNKAISHKGEKRNSYSMEFQKDIVKYAKETQIAVQGKSLK